MSKRLGRGAGVRISHEIVRVIGDTCLVASSSAVWHHLARGGEALAPGFYLALWRGLRGIHERDHRRPRYVGPVPTRRMAELLRISAAHLGLIETARASAASSPVALLEFAAKGKSPSKE